MFFHNWRQKRKLKKFRPIAILSPGSFKTEDSSQRNKNQCYTKRGAYAPYSSQYDNACASGANLFTAAAAKQ